MPSEWEGGYPSCVWKGNNGHNGYVNNGNLEGVSFEGTRFGVGSTEIQKLEKKNPLPIVFCAFGDVLFEGTTKNIMPSSGGLAA